MPLMRTGEGSTTWGMLESPFERSGTGLNSNRCSVPSPDNIVAADSDHSSHLCYNGTCLTCGESCHKS